MERILNWGQQIIKIIFGIIASVFHLLSAYPLLIQAIIYGVYLIFLLNSVLPLVLIGRWKRRIIRKKWGGIIAGVFTKHLIYPTVLLFCSIALYRYDPSLTAKLPNPILVLAVSLVISYLTGIFKAVLLFLEAPQLRNREKKNRSIYHLKGPGHE